MNQKTSAVEEGDYTPGHVWELLTGEIEEDELDPDEMLDLGVGLSRLPTPERTFLALIYQGWSTTKAMEKAGIKGNQTRYMAKALMELTREMNGDDTENRTDEHRAA